MKDVVHRNRDVVGQWLSNLGSKKQRAAGTLLLFYRFLLETNKSASVVTAFD